MSFDRDVRFAMILQNWDPVDRPVHCSNCFHAKVLPGGFVQCSEGHGAMIPLPALCRPRRPRSFKAAQTCEDFRSMSDDDEVYELHEDLEEETVHVYD